jgi:hypothetical protein
LKPKFTALEEENAKLKAENAKLKAQMFKVYTALGLVWEDEDLPAPDSLGNYTIIGNLRIQGILTIDNDGIDGN